LGPRAKRIAASVGIVADPATRGYWLATATGAVLGYDGAPNYGEARLGVPVVAMAATPDTSFGAHHGRVQRCLRGDRPVRPLTGVRPRPHRAIRFHGRRRGQMPLRVLLLGFGRDLVVDVKGSLL
jgi:hypothetical protein